MVDALFHLVFALALVALLVGLHFQTKIIRFLGERVARLEDREFDREEAERVARMEGR